MLYQLSYVRVLTILAAPDPGEPETRCRFFATRESPYREQAVDPGTIMRPRLPGRRFAPSLWMASRPHRQDAATLSGAGSSS
jgi:hypothetical protein